MNQIVLRNLLDNIQAVALNTCLQGGQSQYDWQSHIMNIREGAHLETIKSLLEKSRLKIMRKLSTAVAAIFLSRLLTNQAQK